MSVDSQVWRSAHQSTRGVPFNSPTLFKIFIYFNIFWLVVVAGLAIGMYAFSVPVIKLGRTHSAEIMVRQFDTLVGFGRRYIQRPGQLQGTFLASIAFLLYRHPDPDVASRWKWFALSLAAGVAVAPYEIFFIFPINDAVIAMGPRLKAKEIADSQQMRDEIVDALDSWRSFHRGRILLPLAAATLAMYGMDGLDL